MKTTTTIKAAAIATLHFTLSILNFTAQGAVIQQVIVRQQWPWSTDVKVEYKLAEVTSPVDISVKAFNGDVELPLPAEAMVGDLYGISESGIGQFIIDPVKAFGNAKVAIADFRVELELSDSAANIKEVLYKIYDLTSGSCTDVTRADLLDRKYGTIETNYTALGNCFKSGSNYTTPVTDVIIWTGVTNSDEYATTKLVLRKIPAKNQTFTMGSPTSELGRYDSDGANMPSGRETQHSVSFTNDFYIGVFEVTQQQWWLIKNNWPSQWSLESCRATRPVEYVSYDDIRGSSVGATWPADLSHAVDGSSFLGLLRGMVSGSPKFDLPTEAQWEYACRARSTSAYYNGKECENAAGTYNSANLNPIARYRANGGYPNGEYPTTEAKTGGDTSVGTARVGSYMPNAWGLYDMLGNVAEWCLDYYGAFSSDSITEPTGPLQEDAWVAPPANKYQARLRRGAYCTSPASESRAAFRAHDTWSSKHLACGLRLCLTIVE